MSIRWAVGGLGAGSVCGVSRMGGWWEFVWFFGGSLGRDAGFGALVSGRVDGLGGLGL